MNCDADQDEEGDDGDDGFPIDLPTQNDDGQEKRLFFNYHYCG